MTGILSNSMDEKQFLILLDELLELAPGTLKGDELLENFEEWNSLAVIGYMAMVNEHYGLVVLPRQIGLCASVGDLIALTKV
jgi:acyl carrier protein